MAGQPVALELQPLPRPPEVRLPELPVKPPSNGLPEQNFKNKLQEYTQKLSLQLPVYQSINEGSQHAPKFRCTVLVDGRSYKSSNTFPQRKLAEQDAARVALDDVGQKIKEYGRPLVCEDTTFCKSILNEYAVKMHVEKPTYHTVQQEGMLPVFISSVNFNGVSYNGGTGRNKKEAEQLAARAAILSILDSDLTQTISKIIKSKSKLYAALNNSKDNSNAALPAVNTGNGLVVPLKTRKVAEVTGTDINLLLSGISQSSLGEFAGNQPAALLAVNTGDGLGIPLKKKKEAEVTAGTDINLPLSGISQSSLGGFAQNQATHEFRHAFKKPKTETPIVEIAPPIAFVPAGSEQLQLPSTSVQLPSESVQSLSTLGVKRNRKSKKKAKKRSKVDSQTPTIVLPVHQIPPCPVTQ